MNSANEYEEVKNTEVKLLIRDDIKDHSEKISKVGDPYCCEEIYYNYIINKKSEKDT